MEVNYLKQYYEEIQKGNIIVGLELKTEYVETTQYEENKVISQSRIAGTEIVKGTTLTVEIAIKPKGCQDSSYEEYGTDKECKTKKHISSPFNKKKIITFVLVRVMGTYLPTTDLLPPTGSCPFWQTA